MILGWTDEVSLSSDYLPRLPGDRERERATEKGWLGDKMFFMASSKDQMARRRTELSSPF